MSRDHEEAVPFPPIFITFCGPKPKAKAHTATRLKNIAGGGFVAFGGPQGPGGLSPGWAS
jgi:hypothetical protein